ncbi:MAG: putative ABC transporter permease [Bacillota bacterium]
MLTIFYIIVYGFLGYVLERIINLVFLGVWLDNSVLIMPVQPMYGLGVVGAILIYSQIRKLKLNKVPEITLLMIAAIFTTALSEALSGELYELLYDKSLWDYGNTFSLCTYPYVCVIPTGLFGILSGLSVLLVHPYIKAHTKAFPRIFIIVAIVLVAMDFVYTYSIDFISLF